jgi:predicted dehydrogenase
LRGAERLRDAGQQAAAVSPVVLAKGEVPPKTSLVALVGAGGFAKIKLLPIISRIKNTTIHTIIDTDPANAINVAKQYNAQNYDNNYKNILDNKDINTVIVATPHALHAQQTIDLLSAGKAVFVEKPAAVTNEQYESLKDFLNKNKNYLYCVDFNRSFAPFNIKIKQAIENRTTPIIINYRMNAGFIPKDHWVQSITHGQRLIGEACHIFELFNFFTESQVKNISVNSIDTRRDDLLSNDNFSVHINYEDGSICSLVFTSLGNKLLAKERMELFFDGKSIVMDDYKVLEGYGLKKSFNHKSKYPDKGHGNLLEKFFEAVQNGHESPISVERILAATKMSLEINKII